MSEVVRSVSPCWLLKGAVIKGFGRGSKELGIPTANLDASCLKDVAEDTAESLVSGIYCGFASKGQEQSVYPMVMSIGWNPFYKNKERTCEPWILHDFQGKDFYGEELRLVVCAYIRPECDFKGLEDLKQRIHEDARVAKSVLSQPEWAKHAENHFLKPPPPSSSSS
jgi:riboflavin kinase